MQPFVDHHAFWPGAVTVCRSKLASALAADICAFAVLAQRNEIEFVSWAIPSPGCGRVRGAAAGVGVMR